MVISSTCFPHRDIHKGTWISPDGNTVNQIDHVLVERRMATSILDVKSRRGASCDSDHLLVQIRFRCKISRQAKEKYPKQEKLNLDNLKVSEVQERFERTVSEKLLEENIEEFTIENHWNTISTIILNTAQEVLGTNTQRREEQWFDEECKQAIHERNEAHKNFILRRTRERRTEFENKRRRADKLCRQKKRRYENNRILNIERAFKENETRSAYQLIKHLRQGYKPKTSLCKNKNGEIISDMDEIKKTWMMYFKELLNERAQTPLQQRQQQVEQEGQQQELWEDGEDNELARPPTLEEVRTAIQMQKSHKAPGIDKIPAELFKQGGTNLTEQMYQLIQEIWREEKIPQQWKKSIICPIHKKGDKLLCQNYRGISLLCSGYKILTNILNRRLQPLTEKIIGEYQAGFRQNRSTIDQLFTVKQILAKAWEYDIDVYNLFVDFKQAYDSIDRTILPNILQEFGIPSKLIRLVQMTMTETEAHVCIQGQITDAFMTTQGLKQGDGLAPTLFNLVLEYVIRRLTVSRNNILTNKSTQLAAYADDINIMSRTKTAAEETYVQLKQSSEVVGLTINTNKTKLLIQTRSNRQAQQQQFIDDIEYVNRFTYLGMDLVENNEEEPEINRRLMLANKAYFAMGHIFKSRDVHRKTKLRVYKTIIRPIVSYGCETWVITQKSTNALDVFERKILRRILGPIKENNNWRIRYNNEIYEQYTEPTLAQYTRLQRLRWAGHVARMHENRIPRKLLNARMQGKRPVGRPKKRWEDEVDEDAKNLLKTRSWKRTAVNRDVWRGLMKEAKARLGL